MRAIADAATDGATVNVPDNLAITISGSNGSVTLGANDKVTITGSNDTVSAGGPGNSVTVSGTGNRISISSGAVDLIGASTTVVGDDNTISFSGNNSASMQGSGETYLFGSGLTDENLWFEQVGNDLQVDLMGSDEKITVDDWFGGTGAPAVSSFTADGRSSTRR